MSSESFEPMANEPPRRSDAPSTESYRRPGHPGSQDDPTVISSQPPLRVDDADDESAGRASLGKNGPPSGTLPPGTRLGHFEVQEFIGGGGMGRVYRAEDTILGRPVAIKVLPRSQSADQATIARFFNEAKSAARLNHEHIVKVYFAGEHQGVAYIAFEFITGHNIRAIVHRNGPLPTSVAIGYTLQIAYALAHAARHAVVHRDVKPSNILITSDDRAKLIDMGLARLTKDDDSRSELTASGITLGTFDYISPEQARDPRLADQRSDLYSLGCTLFYMLAGQPPFPEGTVLQKLLQHQGDDPPDIREFRSDVPEEVAMVLRKMMAKEPRHRYQDFGKLIDSLLQLAEMLGLRPAALDATVWVPPRPPRIHFVQRHIPWIVPCAVLLAVVLLLNFWWIPTSPPEIATLTPLDDPTRPQTSTGEEPPPTETEGASTSTPATSGAGEPSAAENAVTRTPQNDAQAETNPRDVAATASPETDIDFLDGLGLRPSLRMPLTSAGLPAITGTDADPMQGRRMGLSPEFVSLKMPPPIQTLRTPREATPPIRPAGEGIHVVAPNENPQTPGVYASLKAACAAAAKGDVIELRFNGAYDLQPFTLKNTSLSIRAGIGYRPTIRFRPSEVDPLEYPRDMITCAGGEFDFENIALELEVPRDILADHWCLFRIEPSTRLSLDHCTLTIRNADEDGNAFHQRTAIFELRPANDGPSAFPLPDGALEELAPSITVENSILRGETTVLRDHGPHGISLAANNALVVVAQRLIDSAIPTGAYEQPGTLSVVLEHATVVARDGLFRVTAPVELMSPPKLHFLVTGSILMPSDRPMLEQFTSHPMEVTRQYVDWIGNHNFYESADTLWVLQPSSASEAQAVAWGPQEWTAHFDVTPLLDAIAWASPRPDRPLQAHTPSDYLLDEDTTPNPARDALPDGSPAGFLPGTLPQL